MYWWSLVNKDLSFSVVYDFRVKRSMNLKVNYYFPSIHEIYSDL